MVKLDSCKMATNDEGWQKVIQDEAWQKLIQDEDWQKLIQDEDWQKLIQDEDWQRAMQDAVGEGSNAMDFGTQPGLDFDFNFELNLPAPDVSNDERMDHGVNSNLVPEDKHNIALPPQLPLLPSLAMESVAGPVPLVDGSTEPKDMPVENYASIIARMENR